MVSGSDDSVTEADVLRALSTVQEPELGRDLVSLNMIENVRVDNGRVSFSVILTTPACPLRAHIERECRAAVQRLPGVGEVSVKLESRVPSGRGRFGKEAIPGVRNVLAVASGKGGVGKTTIAVNLAIALAEAGARVGILDADVTGPNVPLMLGVNGEPRARGDKIEPLQAHGLKVMSIAFFVPDDQPVLWRGPMIAGAIQQFLRDVAWDDLDYLVVDLPPGTGDASLSLAQLIPLSGVLIVSTPQDVALLDAGKSLAMFQKLESPILGFVENMSYFVCPHCGERTEVFGFGGAERAAVALGVPFLGRIPLDPQWGRPRHAPAQVRSGVAAGRGVSAIGFGRGSQDQRAGDGFDERAAHLGAAEREVVSPTQSRTTNLLTPLVRDVSVERAPCRISPGEGTCVDRVRRERWPDGFVRPFCGSTKGRPRYSYCSALTICKRAAWRAGSRLATTAIASATATAATRPAAGNE